MARPPGPSALYLAIGILSWPVVRFVFRLRAHGRAHVPPGGCVLASNHLSNLDPWVLGVPLLPRRFLRFMAKSELYWFPLRLVLDAGGAFPVRRGERDLEAIATAVALCRAGNVVAMFPEGTRRKKGLVKKYEPRAHTGAARIALEAAVPLVPAAVAGTDRLSRLGPLRVVYGEPIDVADLAGHEPKEAAELATERLMREIARLEASL